jgi:DNA-directed RNA polymerase subunit E'/Rpb7
VVCFENISLEPQNKNGDDTYIIKEIMTGAIYNNMYIGVFLTLLAFAICTNKRVYKIFDSIDIHCEIQAVPFAQLSQMQPGEKIRERVIMKQLKKLKFNE